MITPDQIPTPKHGINWIANLNVPSWECYFMTQVFLAAMRSPDQQTKQGAVIVDWNTKIVVGTGYNGHPRGTNGLPTMRAGSALRSFTGSDNNFYRKGEAVPKGIFPILSIPELERAVGDEDFPGSRSDFDALDDLTFTPKHYLLTQWIQGKPDKYTVMCHCETNAMQNGRIPSDNAVLFVPMPSCEACASLMLNNPFVNVRRVVFYEDRNLDQTLYNAKPGVTVEKYDEAKYGDPAELLIRTLTYFQLRRQESESLSAASTRSYR